MFADFDWIRWWLPAWEADNQSSTAVAGGESCPEFMRERLFGTWGLFVWVAIVADWNKPQWLQLVTVLDLNCHGARAGFKIAWWL